MEKEIEEQLEENKPTNIVEETPVNLCRNYIRLANIEIGSDCSTPSQLVNILIWLLDFKQVKKYLDLTKEKQKLNESSYLG